MARRQEKAQAIKLRKLGKTYSEICHILGIPKSTLSGWIGKYPLTEGQITRLNGRIRYKKLIAVEKTTLVKFKKKQESLKETFRQEQEKLLPLTERELYLFGLALYWGEGRKGLGSSISLNNTDPRVVKIFKEWLIKTVKVPTKKMRVALHLYKDMDPEKAISYWSNQLKLDRGHFIKPYVKKSTRSEISQKGYGHGTCGIYVSDQRLMERILLGIDAIAKGITGDKPENLI